MLAERRILGLLAEAEPAAFQPLQEAATVIQKHYRGHKVNLMIIVQCQHERLASDTGKVHWRL